MQSSNVLSKARKVAGEETGSEGPDDCSALWTSADMAPFEPRDTAQIKRERSGYRNICTLGDVVLIVQIIIRIEYWTSF